MEFANTIKFQLNSGNVVELQMTQKLVDQIKEAFSLKDEKEITEKHVKYYLVNGMKNAVESCKDEKSD